MLYESVPFLDRVFRHWAESGWEDWLAKLIVLIVVSALGTLALWIWGKAWPQLYLLWVSRRQLRRALDAVAPESKGIWLASSIPIRRPADYDRWLRTSKPIIVIANLKGGVGKTTIASNLIAHYALKKGERVLAIDLDFQGSLTANALSVEDRNYLLFVQSDGGLSKAAYLIDDRDASWLHDAPDPVAGVPTAKLIPTYYSLAHMENRVMVEWLVGKRKEDVRYNLAKLLHDDIIQRSFDRILIDAPPRLTTASIQALCAATHVLIPTVLDDLSTEAVGAFADQLRLHQSLWPHLKIIGAVGTMTTNSTMSPERPLTDVEVDALAAGRRSLALALKEAASPLRDTSFLPIECFIPDRTELGRAAGHRIVYASDSKAEPIQVVREAFDRLGNEIDRRL
jgi:chromosome partitioning protein